MCFSIPKKIRSVKKGTALLEDGRTITLGKELHPKSGEYLQIAGDIAVGVLSKKEGKAFYRLLDSLNN